MIGVCRSAGDGVSASPVLTAHPLNPKALFRATFQSIRYQDNNDKAIVSSSQKSLSQIATLFLSILGRKQCTPITKVHTVFKLVCTDFRTVQTVSSFAPSLTRSHGLYVNSV